mmetsp:Transcript_47501/g.97096  ORF Transcript_47501/g.97096 Transcript_47501/m.97096 type:complete len:286 (-) Transcript_47501:418-1275(-)
MVDAQHRHTFHALHAYSLLLVHEERGNTGFNGAGPQGRCAREPPPLPGVVHQPRVRCLLHRDAHDLGCMVRMRSACSGVFEHQIPDGDCKGDSSRGREESEEQRAGSAALLFRGSRRAGSGKFRRCCLRGQSSAGVGAARCAEHAAAVHPLLVLVLQPVIAPRIAFALAHHRRHRRTDSAAPLSHGIDPDAPAKPLHLHLHARDAGSCLAVHPCVVLDAPWKPKFRLHAQPNPPSHREQEVVLLLGRDDGQVRSLVCTRAYCVIEVCGRYFLEATHSQLLPPLCL